MSIKMYDCFCSSPLSVTYVFNTNITIILYTTKCLQMAKRKDGVNEYSCTCVAGYTGDKCQTGMLEYHDICRCSSPTSVTYKASFNQLKVSGIDWSSHN